MSGLTHFLALKLDPPRNYLRSPLANWAFAIQFGHKTLQFGHELSPRGHCSLCKHV